MMLSKQYRFLCVRLLLAIIFLNLSYKLFFYVSFDLRVSHCRKVLKLPSSNSPGEKDNTFSKAIPSSITEISRTGADHEDDVKVSTAMDNITNNSKKIKKTVSPVNLVVLRPTWLKVPVTGRKQVGCDVPCFITGDNTVETIQRSSAVIFMLHAIQSIPLNKQEHLDPNMILQSIGVDPTSVIKVGMTFESTRRFDYQFDEIDKYDIEASYRQSSNCFSPFFESQGRGFKLLKPVPKWSSRQSAIAFVTNNCQSTNGREELVKLLQKFVQVDSVSGCLHNKEWPKNVSKSSKIGLLEKYKVYLAAENSIERDYVTEKVYDGLEAGAVPVYFGAPNVKEFVPSNSTVIVPANFTESDIVKVAQTVKKIFNDEPEYKRWTSFKHHVYKEWLKKRFSLI